MGLFHKEACCLCGGKTGLLDKKCLSGKVCKDCAKKTSPWFTDWKNADKLLLETHLSVREADVVVAKMGNFNKVFGEFGVILIDEAAKEFIAFPDTSKGLFGSQRKVRSLDDVIDLGPDVISFDAVEDFEIDITETSREEKRTENGQQVSFFPPRFVYMETFTLRLKLRYPFFKSMSIQLNDGAVQIHNEGRRLWTDPGRKLAANLLGLPGLVREEQEAVFDNESLLHAFLRSDNEMPDYSYGFKCTPFNWEEIRRYHYYLAMAREIQRIITGKE
ncbi:MAG: DUF4428 domain-containing protein, partial [Oscillospiraceae bacterium]|nr:DUF4428 domain-containing protein [Oscillospiraceae bacterium]